MKTALLHYWLTNMRGGEKVLAALAEMFPDADVFTHAHGVAMRDEGEKKGGGGQWNGHSVYESFIAQLPFGRKWPQTYLPLMPLANRRFDLNGYDLIISSESGPIKGVRKPKGARHICYCHTPMRYVWDMYDEYYARTGLGGKLAMKLFTPYMRYEDLKSADSVDTFVANSRFVADRIKRIYGRDAVVVHPPVNVDFFSVAARPEVAPYPARPEVAPYPARPEVAPCRNYYLFAGASVKYKRLDLAEAACKRMGRKLIVASGVSDEELRALYAGAKALLFPGLEDFGIVPVEAQAAGTPVIAYGHGGALETVKDGKTGLFFHEQTVESLCAAIEEFESRSWDGGLCVGNARRFAPSEFENGMREVLRT